MMGFAPWMKSPRETKMKNFLAISRSFIARSGSFFELRRNCGKKKCTNLPHQAQICAVLFVCSVPVGLDLPRSLNVYRSNVPTWEMVDPDLDLKGSWPQRSFSVAKVTILFAN